MIVSDSDDSDVGSGLRRPLRARAGSAGRRRGDGNSIGAELEDAFGGSGRPHQPPTPQRYHEVVGRRRRSSDITTDAGSILSGPDVIGSAGFASQRSRTPNRAQAQNVSSTTTTLPNGGLVTVKLTTASKLRRSDTESVSQSSVVSSVGSGLQPGGVHSRRSSATSLPYSIAETDSTAESSVPVSDLRACACA